MKMLLQNLMRNVIPRISLRRLVRATRASLWWRVTAPLRVLKEVKIVRRLVRRLAPHVPFRGWLSLRPAAAIRSYLDQGQTDLAESALKYFKNQLSPLQHRLGQALTVTDRDGYQASLPLWQQIWDERQGGTLAGDPRGAGQLAPCGCPSKEFEVVRVNTTDSRKERARVCVYTSLFGRYDELLPVLTRCAGIDFICFADERRATPGWKFQVREPKFGDPALDSRYYKILPYDHLSDYEYSLYVDANTFIYGDLGGFLQRWLIGNPFVMWAHPFRDDVYDESQAILVLAKHEPEAIVRQFQAYQSAGLPRKTGLVEAAFIWRKHADRPTRDLMQAWWQEVSTKSKRDQLSLGYLMWSRKQRPKVLPERLGNARTNVVLATLPHNNHATKREPTVSGGRCVKAVTTQPKVRFLYPHQSKPSAATMMRGEQLATVMAKHCPGQFDLGCTSNLDEEDAIVILTKSAFQEIRVEDLVRLRRRNLAVLADFVDMAPRPEVIENCDMLVAASIKGMIALRRQFPDKACAHLTHHVDPRIGSIEIPRDRLRIGYFGEFPNTHRYQEVLSEVVFIRTDTRNPHQVRWIGELHRFNMHYALRKARPGEEHKPFMKGFTAAHCGANIMIQRNAGDAEYYLGEDYPYLLADHEPETVSCMLDFVRDSFQGPDWRRALEAMAALRARCSTDWVAREFKNIIESVIA